MLVCMSWWEPLLLCAGIWPRGGLGLCGHSSFLCNCSFLYARLRTATLHHDDESQVCAGRKAKLLEVECPFWLDGSCRLCCLICCWETTFTITCLIRSVMDHMLNCKTWTLLYNGFVYPPSLLPQGGQARLQVHFPVQCQQLWNGPIFLLFRFVIVSVYMTPAWSCCYYWRCVAMATGRIRAIQLDYSEAHKQLIQVRQLAWWEYIAAY